MHVSWHSDIRKSEDEGTAEGKDTVDETKQQINVDVEVVILVVCVLSPEGEPDVEEGVGGQETELSEGDSNNEDGSTVEFHIRSVKSPWNLSNVVIFGDHKFIDDWVWDNLVNFSLVG